MTRFLLLAICFLASAVSFAQKLKLVDSGKVLEDASASYDSGNYSLAIKKYLTIPARDTNYVAMLDQLARTYTAAKEYDKAIEICDKGLARPNIYKASFLRNKGNALEKKGEYEKAVAHFDALIEAYPTDHIAVYFLGIAHYNKKAYDKAKECFFRVLTINPFHAGSHLNLATLSIGEGRKVHGMLSMAMYLAINNGDNQRLVLLNNFLANQVTDESTISTTDPNAFEKLDQIIRAKMALDKNFKSKIPVDAAVVKQYEMLFEQMGLINFEIYDPWATAYLPVFKKIKEQNLVEPFIYHMLSSSNNDVVKKWIKKNEKSLQTFYATANEGLQENRLYPTVPASLGFGKKTNGWYDDNKRLVALGNKNEAGKKEGRWLYFYDNGERSAEGMYNNNEEKVGTWKYYYGNGNLKQIDNTATGECTSYYFEGGKYEHFYRKNGMLEGDVEIYYPCGTIKEKLKYKNDKLHGPGETYYATGKVHKKFTYADGLLNGDFITYHDNGTLQSKYSSKEGKAQGPYVQYHRNGKLEKSGNYLDDQLDGDWKYFYANNKPDRKGAYKKDLPIGEWLFYNERGELVEKRVFNENGELNGDNTFYKKGKLHFVQSFVKDLMVKVAYYDTTGKEIAKYGKNDGTFALKTYYTTGQVNSEGNLRKGETHGKWTYYYRHGQKRSEFNYVDGKLQGEGTEYFPSGAKKSVVQYKDDETHGYAQYFFEHGTVQEEGWFVNGERQQQWVSYYPDGKIDEDSYYMNNELVEESYDYNTDGKMLSLTLFNSRGDVENFQTFNGKGELTSVASTEGPKRVFETKYKNKKSQFRLELQCGVYHGEVKRWYPDGSLYYSSTSINNKRDGIYKTFTLFNTPLVEGRYDNGRASGVWTGFFDTGKPEYIGRYRDDNQDSTWTYYFPHGKVSSISEYFNDKREGLTQIFSAEGSPAVEKMFDNGDFVSYRTMTAAGQWTDWTAFTGNAVIKAYHNDGSISFEEEYKNGKLNGLRRVYFSKARLFSEDTFVNGDYHGKFISYFPNGKPRKKGEYQYDELFGLLEHYNEDGTLKSSEFYVYGIRNGKATLYSKGVKTKEYNFWGGVAYE